MAPTALSVAEIVAEARSFEIPHVVHRDDVIGDLPEPKPFNLVHIITGIRRCGKTFYAFQWIRRLIDRGVDAERIFYFNFADDRLRPAPDTLMSDILEEYWRQVPSARTKGCYPFLDEVQETDGWQGVCQRLAEHESVTLVITGSSSKLSADEIATQFRARKSTLCIRFHFASTVRFIALKHRIGLPVLGFQLFLRDSELISSQHTTVIS